jgi:bacillithiol synthase
MDDGAVQLMSRGYELRVEPLLGGGALVRDYLIGRDLSPFFAGHYSDPAAYERKAAEVDARLGAADRMRVADAVEPVGDAGPRLQQILSGNGYFITTGQQPALLGGPLYTLYKILGAVRLAELAEQRLRRPVLALFWIGSDDHDWDEASQSALLDGAKYVHRLQVRAPANTPPRPLYQRIWGPHIERVVEEFSALLPDSSHTRAVLHHVRETYTPAATVAASFTATMRLLLAGQRVALVDSSHPSLRRAATPVMRVEAERTEQHGKMIAAQTQRLSESGYTAQVSTADGASNLMLIDTHGRDRLLRTPRGWVTRRQRRAMAEAELLDRIDADPDSFSPNVLLRPVVENAVFPTIAYVAGPAELSYFAQIGCLFEAHGILPPVVVPRPSVLVLDEKSVRKLDALGVDAEFLMRPFRDVEADAIMAALPRSVSRGLEALREALLHSYETLANAAQSVDPTLRGPIIAARNRALLEANAVEKKIAGRIRRRGDGRIEQLRRLAASVQPDGKPQERVFGPLPLLAAYGTTLIDDIAAAMPMDVPTVARWQGPRCG